MDKSSEVKKFLDKRLESYRGQFPRAVYEILELCDYNEYKFKSYPFEEDFGLDEEGVHSVIKFRTYSNKVTISHYDSDTDEETAECDNEADYFKALSKKFGFDVEELMND